MLQEFRDIVDPIIILATALSTSAFAQILRIPRCAIDDRLDLLRSVLSVSPSTGSPLRFLHLSVGDFLVNPDKRKRNPFWIDEKQIHRAMAANCLWVLRCLKQDIYGIPAPGSPRSTVSPHKISTVYR